MDGALSDASLVFYVRRTRLGLCSVCELESKAAFVFKTHTKLVHGQSLNKGQLWSLDRMAFLAPKWVMKSIIRFFFGD